MKIVTAADFETEVLKSKTPVLVDFFATWCPPCKALSPILEKIATEKAADLKIVKVDVDASPEIAAQYAIQSMPTLLIIRDGEVISRTVGAAPKSEVIKWIDKSLTLKQVTLSESDKKQLRKAFEAAVNKSPDADVPTTVLTVDGSETTLRKMTEKGLNDGSIFKNVEMILTQAEVPVKEYIKSIKNMTLALPKPPKP